MDMRTPPTTRHVRDSRSVTDLLKELRDETTTLFKQEVALAKTEMSEKASTFGRNGAYLAAGGMVAYIGALCIVASLCVLLAWGLMEAGLSIMLAWVLSPLLIGAVIAIIGYGFVQKAITTFQHEPLVPERTVQTLKEDKEWVQHKVS